MTLGQISYSNYCKVCRTPIRGVRSIPYRLRGTAPYNKNPQLCNRCSKVSFPAVERDITVLFADIRGFTSMSEKLPPNQVRQWLNAFFASASELLIQNDALIDKFMGDAIMALFNAPIPQEQHRPVAIRTALDLHERVTRLQLPFAIGIGLNSGVALTGNVGAGEVTDYTAIGDVVNVASRLSSLASKGETLAGASTCEGHADTIPEGYAWERLALQVRGREQEVEAYRIYPIPSPIQDRALVTK